MLSEKQLSKLKKMLLEQKNDLVSILSEKENEVTSHGSLRDSVDELSTVDNHPADLATELYDREKDLALKVHNEDLLTQVTAALERIENGTYGICIKCHEAIPYDRLRSIPYTAFCIADTEAKSIPTDRPAEEDLLRPAVDNSFSNREENDTLQDDEDSFRIVAQYGNSDTPADFEGDFDDYNDLYSDKDGTKVYADIDELHVSQDEYLEGQISQQYAEEARKTDYLE